MVSKPIAYIVIIPFGNINYSTGKTETEVSQKRYKYCGKEKDEESGLYYYGARYYAPWICRFVSVDPLQHKYPYYTPYQYAGNKPITYIDLDGLEATDNEKTNTSRNGQQSQQGEFSVPQQIPDYPFQSDNTYFHRQEYPAIEIN